MSSRRTLRALAVLTCLLGANYIVWRWLYSVHWAAWWIAVPLVLAETYSFVDSLLFAVTMWRVKVRTEAPPAPAGAGVDVFITTYNEPLDLVMTTARAAKAIRYPHTTWILDDGARPELRALAEAEGIGVVSRSSDWVNRPRHAKAGNLNNAFMVTTGEFVLILDADQIPDPAILDKTLGYFTDPTMALVQTPQYFTNVPADDPLGSQAPLFYGPIQQGKDGWNAAFFCGSNAVIRREALMQLGLVRYVETLDSNVRAALAAADKVLARALRQAPADTPAVGAALEQVRTEVRHARSELARGLSLGEVTYRFQRRVAAAARAVVEADLAAMRAELASLPDATLPAQLADPAAAAATADSLVDELAAQVSETYEAPAPPDAGALEALDPVALDLLTRRDLSPLAAIVAVRQLIETVDVDNAAEAQPIMPMATISVTEDMATCMRLHTLGWRSAYHHEILAVGLAPEDLGTMLTQRLRWAQGTVQVMLRENPLTQKGLTLAQRLMYFATMWSYLSGFAAVVYVAAPVLYLLAGVLPVQAWSVPFFERLVPFLVLNQLLFFLVGRGKGTWRGQQYSLALFPVWIRSVTTACANVWFHRPLGFAVTPKTRQDSGRLPWHLVRPQLVTMVILVVSVLAGIVRLATGHASVLGVTANLVWVAYDLLIFSVIIKAVRYRGYSPEPDLVSTTVEELRP